MAHRVFHPFSATSLSPGLSLQWFCIPLRWCHTQSKPEPGPSFPLTPDILEETGLNFLTEPISSCIPEPATRVSFLSAIPHLSWTLVPLGSARHLALPVKEESISGARVQAHHTDLTEASLRLFLSSLGLPQPTYFTLTSSSCLKLASLLCLQLKSDFFLKVADLTWEAGSTWLAPGTKCNMPLSHPRSRRPISAPFWRLEETPGSGKCRAYQFTLVIHLLDALPTYMVFQHSLTVVHTQESYAYAE